MNGKAGGEPSNSTVQTATGNLPRATVQAMKPEGGLVEHLVAPALTEKLSLLMFGENLPFAETDVTDNVQHGQDTDLH